MLSIGLLGLGRHGRRYADHLVRGDVPGARLAGFWRRDAALAAADAHALGVPALPTPEALIAQADALIVVVPAGHHAALAEAVAAAQKPLLLEKPLARDAREGRALVDRFTRDRVQLMVAQTLRFDPLTERLCTVMGRLGPLRGFGFEQRLEPRGLAWENDRALAGGGVLLQTGVHAIDALGFVTGSRVEVEHAHVAHVHGNATEDQAWVRLRAGGVAGDLRTSKIGRGRRHRYALFFEDGAVEADYVARTFDDGSEISRVEAVPTVARATEAFVRWVGGEIGECPVPPEEALAAVAVVDAAYAAARQ